jgi:hypothetical protein
MRIAHDARAKLTSDLKKQQGTAMANTEGGGALQTTKALAATHPRSLAAMLDPSSLPQRSQETGTR